MGQTFRSFMNAGGKTTASVGNAGPVQPHQRRRRTARRERIVGNCASSVSVNSRITLADLGVGTTSVGFNLETTLRNIPLSAGVDRYRRGNAAAGDRRFYDYFAARFVRAGLHDEDALHPLLDRRIAPARDRGNPGAESDHLRRRGFVLVFRRAGQTRGRNRASGSRLG